MSSALKCLTGFLAATACVAGSMGVNAAHDGREYKTVEVFSKPIELKYGEVHNRYQEPVLLPADVIEEYANKTMAVVDYHVDIVGYDKNGNEFQVPLYDMYNHHYIFIMGGQKDLNAYYDSIKDTVYGFDPPKNTSELLDTFIDYDLEREDLTVGNPNTYDDRIALPAESMLGRRRLQSKGMKGIQDEVAKAKLAAAQQAVSHKVETNRTISAFGGGSGAEERMTSHHLPEGYGYFVDSPEALIALYHFINTREPNASEFRRPSLQSAGASAGLWECPCSPQRAIDPGNGVNGTIDGNVPLPPFGTCNKEFVDEKNPSCFLDTYVGGYRCCENGVFLIDTNLYDTEKFPIDTVYAKFTLNYTDADNLKNATFIFNHDVTGDLETLGNGEYDVPKCSENTKPEDCYYEKSSVQYLYLANPDPSQPYHDAAENTDLVEIPYIVGHLHVGGIALDVYNDDTGELLCHSVAKYGNGTEAGNEEGFVVEMTPCVFEGEDIPVLPKNTKIRTTASYNNTEAHTGVMALTFIAMADHTA